MFTLFFDVLFPMFLFTRCSELDFRYTIMFTMFSLQGAQDLIFDVLCLHSFCLHGAINHVLGGPSLIFPFGLPSCLGLLYTQHSTANDN